MSKKSQNKKTQADKAGENSVEKSAVRVIWDEVKFIAKLGGFLFLLYTFVFGQFRIPTESMVPTLEVGDRLYVSKYAYGYSKHSLPFNFYKLPFLPDGKIFSRLPKRGDIVVFRNPNDVRGTIMIKRLVGLPGDEIVMSKGRLYINGEIVPRELIETFEYYEDKGPRSLVDKILGRRKYHHQWGNKIPSTSYKEIWPDTSEPHIIFEVSDEEAHDNTRPLIVPEGHVFFMGDNRDRSHDSRARGGPGFVPLDHIIGRADLLLFSLKSCPEEPLRPCPKRGIFKPL